MSERLPAAFFEVAETSAGLTSGEAAYLARVCETAPPANYWGALRQNSELAELGVGIDLIGYSRDSPDDPLMARPIYARIHGDPGSGDGKTALLLGDGHACEESAHTEPFDDFVAWNPQVIKRYGYDGVVTVGTDPDSRLLQGMDSRRRGFKRPVGAAYRGAELDQVAWSYPVPGRAPKYPENAAVLYLIKVLNAVYIGEMHGAVCGPTIYSRHYTPEFDHDMRRVFGFHDDLQLMRDHPEITTDKHADGFYAPLALKGFFSELEAKDELDSYTDGVPISDHVPEGTQVSILEVAARTPVQPHLLTGKNLVQTARFWDKTTMTMKGRMKEGVAKLEDRVQPLLLTDPSIRRLYQGAEWYASVTPGNTIGQAEAHPDAGRIQTQQEFYMHGLYAHNTLIYTANVKRVALMLGDMSVAAAMHEAFNTGVEAFRTKVDGRLLRPVPRSVQMAAQVLGTLVAMRHAAMN